MGSVLLKLGGQKHLGEQRWRDALNVFEKIYCGRYYREKISASWEIEDKRIKVIEIRKTLVNHFLHGCLWRTKNYKGLKWLNDLLIFLFKAANMDWRKSISRINADAVLCSYGDYDFSNLVSVLAEGAIIAPVVKSYKESRVEYNYLELRSFQMAKVVSLYDKELKLFLEKKYGTQLFDGKRVLLGYDENALPRCVTDKIKYQEKLSSKDGKTHVAILSYRVDSEPLRNRDQNRYYYIDLIKELTDADITVHLHCAVVNPDRNGKNAYEHMMEQKKGCFFLEKPLEMKHSSSIEQWVESCELLSRYDAGILHNIVDGSAVSEFDRINIPHRFFAYEAAHVVPVIKKGENIVLEKIFREKNCGFIYETYKDMTDIKGRAFDYYVPVYEDYLRALFGGVEK